MNGALVFDANPPRGVFVKDHFRGFIDDYGQSVKGLNAFLLELADECKGMRAVEVSQTICTCLLMLDDFIWTTERDRQRNGPHATWRGHPVYVCDDITGCIGFFVERRNGTRLGQFTVIGW